MMKSVANKLWTVVEVPKGRTVSLQPEAGEPQANAEPKNVV